MAAFCWVTAFISEMELLTWAMPAVCFRLVALAISPHDLGHVADALHDFVHGGTGLVHLGATGFNLAHRLVDQLS